MSSYPRLPTTFDSASALFLSPSPNPKGFTSNHFLNPPLPTPQFTAHRGKVSRSSQRFHGNLLSVSGLVLRKVTCNTVPNQTVYKNMH